MPMHSARNLEEHLLPFQSATTFTMGMFFRMMISHRQVRTYYFSDTSYAWYSYRKGHQRLHVLLSERISKFHSASKDAHPRGSCSPLVKEVQHWGWANGWAGSWISTFPCSQVRGDLPRDLQQSRQIEVYLQYVQLRNSSCSPKHEAWYQEEEEKEGRVIFHTEQTYLPPSQHICLPCTCQKCIILDGK